MRIDGKRASAFTNEQLAVMMGSGKSVEGKPLTPPQKDEIFKTWQMRLTTRSDKHDA